MSENGSELNRVDVIEVVFEKAGYFYKKRGGKKPGCKIRVKKLTTVNGDLNNVIEDKIIATYGCLNGKPKLNHPMPFKNKICAKRAWNKFDKPSWCENN